MVGLIEFITGILVPTILVAVVAGGAAFAIIFIVEWTDR
jgi:hypothetical protein